MNPEIFELTLEQQFQMRLIEQSTDDLNRDQLADMLLEVSRLLMVKDNVIRDLLKQNVFV
ncbi:MAG: NblA/ycf18 family protein [Cyanosarcina radialis HA8281-LM2]|jgi:hypothetical protein|nr:NblA/ycf18 family protein [Cyanosarcina radialis HA8281-LM2]